jgi:hypothetical protein
MIINSRKITILKIKDHRDKPMAQKLDDSEIVSFKELLMANSIQVDALAQLMIKKGFITKEEFFEMLKEVQAEYQRKTND